MCEVVRLGRTLADVQRDKGRKVYRLLAENRRTLEKAVVVGGERVHSDDERDKHGTVTKDTTMTASSEGHGLEAMEKTGLPDPDGLEVGHPAAEIGRHEGKTPAAKRDLLQKGIEAQIQRFEPLVTAAAIVKDEGCDVLQTLPALKALQTVHALSLCEMEAIVQFILLCKREPLLIVALARFPHPPIAPLSVPHFHSVLRIDLHAESVSGIVRRVVVLVLPDVHHALLVEILNHRSHIELLLHPLQLPVLVPHTPLRLSRLLAVLAAPAIPLVASWVEAASIDDVLGEKTELNHNDAPLRVFQENGRILPKPLVLENSIRVKEEMAGANAIHQTPLQPDHSIFV